MYAIQKYVLEIIKEKGIKRAELVKRLGYTNISKGCRRLDAFLRNLECQDMILNNLRYALDVSEEDFQLKMRETNEELEEERRQQEKAERKRFRPFLYCQTQHRIPSPIFAAAMLGGNRMRFIYLPEDYNLLSINEQEIKRKQLIAETLLKTDGGVPGFGWITCFTLKQYYDDEEHEREVYDLKGDLISDPPAEYMEISEGRAHLFIKGRDISRVMQHFIVKDVEGE